MVKKILIVVEDQAPDLCFIGKGIELAGQLNAEIGLVDVAKLSIGFIETGLYTADLENFDRQRAAKTVEKIKAEYPDVVFADFEEVGDPVEEIRLIVDEWKPDLLIVGHHKHSFLLRLSENSRERRIINQLKIPVFVIPCE